jgi:hypothetical protein
MLVSVTALATLVSVATWLKSSVDADKSTLGNGGVPLPLVVSVKGDPGALARMSRMPLSGP